MIAYIRYKKRSLKCLASSDSRRYKEYVYINVYYNLASPSISDQEKLKKEEDRLAFKEAEAFTKIL